MHKVFDIHSHYVTDQEYNTNIEVGTDKYKIDKSIVSIDPLIPRLICKKNNEHYMYFTEGEDNKVGIKCMDCQENKFLGVDPYILYNEELLNKCDSQNQFVFIMPALVKSSVNESINYLVNKFSSKVKGIKLYTGTTFTTLDEIGTIQSSLPLLIHTGIFKNQDPKNMFRFLKNYKGKICLAHFARFDQATMEFIRASENIIVDTSPAQYIFDRYIKGNHNGGLFDRTNINTPEDLYYKIIDELGIDKVVWGSDFPYSNIAEEISVVNNLNLTADEKDKLLFNNAMDFMN